MITVTARHFGANGQSNEFVSVDMDVPHSRDIDENAWATITQKPKTLLLNIKFKNLADAKEFAFRLLKAVGDPETHD